MYASGMEAETQEALGDYVAAEDALRAFTDRNFGRMCAICARWTLLAAQSEAKWRLSSWVTNCCNANHALESMSEDSLAGIVASREEGRAWWAEVKRAAAAPCAALTDQGCALKRGRPELCNRYFCEAVRDYLWILGGEHRGAQLAERLDELQRRWTSLYSTYQRAVQDARDGLRTFRAVRLRREAGTDAFLDLLERFDGEIAGCARPIDAATMTDRLFKVSGDESAYRPFFEREITAVNGEIRRPGV